MISADEEDDDDDRSLYVTDLVYERLQVWLYELDEVDEGIERLQNDEILQYEV